MSQRPMDWQPWQFERPPEGETDHFREVTDMMGKEGKDGKVSAPPEGETNVRSHHHSPDDSSPASADVGGELQAEAAVASPTMSAEQFLKDWAPDNCHPPFKGWEPDDMCRFAEAYAAALTAEVARLLQVLRRIAVGYVVPGTDALHINHPSVAEAAGAIIATEAQLAKTNH